LENWRDRGKPVEGNRGFGEGKVSGKRVGAAGSGDGFEQWIDRFAVRKIGWDLY
jgi:hypothetical protein